MLDGFLIDVHTTSESRLLIEVDATHLSWDRYNSLLMELEDVLTFIDKKYSAKSKLVRERRLAARYQRIQKDVRRKRLSFSPFPSKFTNVLKNVRSYVYSNVKNSCITLENIGNRKLYFLPKELAPSFAYIIEEINSKTISKLNSEIREFMKTEEYNKILSILEKYEINVGQKVFEIGRFDISVIPFNANYRVDEDEVYKSMKRDEELKGIDILRKQIEKKRMEYAEKAVKDAIRRILDIVEQYDSGKRIVFAEKKLQRLRKLCESLEMKEVISKVLDPLEKILLSEPDEREKVAEKEFGTWKLKEAVQKVLDSLQTNFLGENK